MPVKILKEYLENHHVKYQSLLHAPAFTAQEVAESVHISGKKMAKVVIVQLGGKLAMVVLPAHDTVNFKALKSVTGLQDVGLAAEVSFKTKFPECETGAMPPFGNLYDMPVYVSSHLAELNQIAFNAGTHTEIVQMAYEDFARLVHPKVIASS